MVCNKSKPKKRNRVGPNEMKKIRGFRNAISRFKFERGSVKGENSFVKEIRSHLIQKRAFEGLKRQKIGEVATILGKKYMPDLVLPGRKNLLAVEFKLIKGRTTDDDAFKAGVAQAVIDRIKYKYVILALVDISKNGKHRSVDKRSSPNYKKLYNKLKMEKIEILTMGPTKRNK